MPRHQGRYRNRGTSPERRTKEKRHFNSDAEQKRGRKLPGHPASSDDDDLDLIMFEEELDDFLGFDRWNQDDDSDGLHGLDDFDSSH